MKAKNVICGMCGKDMIIIVSWILKNGCVKTLLSCVNADCDNRMTVSIVEEE